MYENNLYLNDLFELLAAPVGIEHQAAADGTAAERHACPSVGQTVGEIVFDHVTFRYPGRDEDAIADVSFTIRAGETVAIVGRNGAGKSTLIKLVHPPLRPDVPVGSSSTASTFVSSSQPPCAASSAGCSRTT